jgi:hypothetical protein
MWLVRLGAELPFARAAFWLEELTGLAVSAASVRRHTEAVGATAVAQAAAEVARLGRETPGRETPGRETPGRETPGRETPGRETPEVQPARLVLGADGAMVPLLGGEWAEVKLLSIGEPSAASGAGSGSRSDVRAQHVSYFARLADAETFGAQALVELYRRGVEAAGAVAAVQDGAPWLQGFVDYHRPDALRILDWPHAAQHLTAVAEQVFGVQTARARRVAERLRRWLWEEGPPRVLAVLAGWQRARPAHAALATAVAYLRERQTQLDYPAFRAAGWPVGSGATESGHKQVMQARMKRAGMRWARPHVNPLLALTLLEHNGRWLSDGPALLAQHRMHTVQQRRQRHATRNAAPSALAAPPPPRPRVPSPPASAAPAASRPQRLAADSTPRHPWRRYGPWLSAKI